MNIEQRPMLVGVYREPQNRFQPIGGVWWMVVSNPQTGSETILTLTPRKAAELITVGVPEVQP